MQILLNFLREEALLQLIFNILEGECNLPRAVDLFIEVFEQVFWIDALKIFVLHIFLHLIVEIMLLILNLKRLGDKN